LSESTNQQYLVKTLHGLEEILAAELEELGAQKVTVLRRAVSFEGDKKMMYRANLELRTALRILKPIAQFQAKNEHQLYDGILNIDWSEYLDLKSTFAIDGVTSSSFFNHSKYVALKSKDAIADQFREKLGRRPNVNPVSPDLRINVFIQEQNVHVALDSSGDSLHKRNHGRETLEAPINEVLAAGMIRLSGWNADRPFLDPMCGSGTLPIEAAMMAYNIPSQVHRTDFGFMRWPDYDSKLWATVKEEANGRIRDFEHPIMGYDNAFQAVRIAERNVAQAGLDDKIIIKRQKFERLTEAGPSGTIVMNPPYDERLAVDDIFAFYQMIGDQFKQVFGGHEAWIISSNMDAIKHIGLRASKKITLYNGPLECKFLKFELYAGSKKQKHQQKKES